MEDTKEGNGKCAECAGKHGCCGYCGWGGGHHHGRGHLILKIVILVVVFWAGTQFGELKAFRGGYMMGGYGGYYGQGYDQYGPGMMYRIVTGQGTTTVR